MDTNYNKLLNNLDELGLSAIRNNLSNYLRMISEEQKDVVTALYELSELEKGFDEQLSTIRH